MRLIDADSHRKRLTEVVERNGGFINCSTGLLMAIDELDKAPTIEAEPVKHGAWEKRKTDSGLLAVCTVCGYPTSWWNKTQHCPDCGAKMDKEESKCLK